jgi:hypothetical protein
VNLITGKESKNFKKNEGKMFNYVLQYYSAENEFPDSIIYALMKII